MSDGVMPEQNPSAENEISATETERNVPYSRFQQVIQQKNELATRLEALEAAERQRQEAEALARGEHEQVIASLKPQAAKVDRYAEVVERLLQSELETVPEQFHALVPPGDPVDRLEWVVKARQTGMFAPPAAPKPAPPATNARAGTMQQGDGLSDAEREIAAKMGISPEDYAKSKRKLMGE